MHLGWKLANMNYTLWAWTGSLPYIHGHLMERYSIWHVDVGLDKKVKKLYMEETRTHLLEEIFKLTMLNNLCN